MAAGASKGKGKASGSAGGKGAAAAKPKSGPPVEGALVRLDFWVDPSMPESGELSLSKKDATAFLRAVKKYGTESKMDAVAAEVGPALEDAPDSARTALYNALINGCTEVLQKAALHPELLLHKPAPAPVAGAPAEGAAAAKAAPRAAREPTLDFFGVPVRATELLQRVHELKLLGHRVNTCKDPFTQFRLESSLVIHGTKRVKGSFRRCVVH